MEKEIFYKIHSRSFGDTIAATPTLRELYHAYEKKINVVTHAKYIFISNPYIDRLLSFDEYDDLVILNSDFEILESFVDAGYKNQRGVEKKFATMDLRNSHSMDLGFEITPAKRHYDYYPEKKPDWLNIDQKYVVLHVTSNWPNRTWDYSKWDSVIKWLAYNKIYTITVGMDYSEILHDSVSKKPLVKKCPQFRSLYGMDLTNKGSLSDMWHVINEAECIVTMDSGPLHLAGTTDTHIIQIGTALDPFYRSPYRKGSREYKYTFVGGSCQIFCNNNLKYSVKEWNTINSVPPLDGCLERKSEFECHPSPEKVINEIKRILNI